MTTKLQAYNAAVRKRERTDAALLKANIIAHRDGKPLDARTQRKLTEDHRKAVQALLDIMADMFPGFETTKVPEYRPKLRAV
jgi:hypothetical protein